MACRLNYESHYVTSDMTFTTFKTPDNTSTSTHKPDRSTRRKYIDPEGVVKNRVGLVDGHYKCFISTKAATQEY